MNPSNTRRCTVIYTFKLNIGIALIGSQYVVRFGEYLSLANRGFRASVIWNIAKLKGGRGARRQYRQIRGSGHVDAKLHVNVHARVLGFVIDDGLLRTYNCLQNGHRLSIKIDPCRGKALYQLTEKLFTHLSQISSKV